MSAAMLETRADPDPVGRPASAAASNSPGQSQARLRRGRVSARAVVLLLPARWALAGLVFTLAALLAALLHAPDPLGAAGGWWMVWGTLVDLGCLAALAVLVRREGVRLVDLLVLDRQHVARDLLLGLGLVFTLIPALVIVQLLQGLFYPAQLPPQIALVHLPAWATVYAVLVWPAIWAVTEQLTYLGYLFPRLEVLTRRTSAAAVIVMLVWSVQHIALPFVPDARYLAYRTLTTVPIAITAIVLYRFVLRRRLLPLVVVHWVADVLAALSPVLFLQA